MTDFDRSKPTPRGEREPAKHKNPQRNWAKARNKVASEGRCRRCHSRFGLEAAHIIPRSRISAGRGGEEALNIIPLCRWCHRAYDELGVDFSGYLTMPEWEYAVGLVGEAEARRRITNKRDAA